MSIKFYIGMFLISINQILGWGGMLFSFHLEKKTHKIKYFFIGIFIYLISWGVLFLGISLAGPDGVKIAKELIYKLTQTRHGKLIILFFIILLLAIIYKYFIEKPVEKK